MREHSGRIGLVCVLLVALLPASAAWAQEPAKDPLGRDTPRGTVVGFMNASREGHDDVASQYLNTGLSEQDAIKLARKLFVVLDSRLSPRLADLSDRPEGSLANPLKPDQDVVGTILTADGTLELVVEHVNKGPLPKVWLFSRKTLEAIPDVYDEIDLVVVDRFLPTWLTRTRIGGNRLFEWLSLVLFVPLLYRLSGSIGPLIRPAVSWWRRRRGRPDEVGSDLMPGAARLLLIAVMIRWLLRVIELPLLERMFWSWIATSLTIAGVVWTLLLLSAAAERYILARLRATGHAEIAAMVRLGRRAADGLAIVAGVLVMLHYFGIDPTAALAGLGIGGIAVALAAQKTLENVIGGLSIVIDQAVHVGDFIKMGDMQGTVDSIGLRSTRLRTPDRTILTVPNGQVATVNVETMSARDKFWFHHFIGLRYETTATQIRTIVDDIRTYLSAYPRIDPAEPIRARLYRISPYSFDIEVFAYVRAANWDLFLDAQQELLLEIMDIVERSGAAIALPSQTLEFIDARQGAMSDRHASSRDE